MEDDEDEQSGGGGLPTELLLGYLAFGRQALRERWKLAAAISVLLSGVAFLVATYWPRTYHSESRMMAQRNDVLAMRGDSVGDALRGAEDVVMSRENLAQIVKQVDLVRLWDERRAPILRLKDAITSRLRGPMSDKEKLDGLVGLLRDKLTVTVATGDGTLNLSVDWPDARSAAAIVDAAEQNFLAVRHAAEISMIADYAAILEDHATDARKDVESLADAVRQSRKDRIARVKEAQKVDKASEGVMPSSHYVSRSQRPEEDEELSRLKSQLESKQRNIAELEDDRRRRLLEGQTKLSDLETKYTEAHPAVLDAKQKIAALSHESPQTTALRQDVDALQDSIRRRQSSAQAAAGLGSTMLQHSESRSAAAEPLPSDIADLLDSRDIIDPALAEQFDSAVRKYRALRDQISSAQIDLDTAQLAFKHRYKVVAPAEVPLKPIKPKVGAILGGGIFASLLLGVIAAILAALRADRIVQRWQVQQLALPVLADLRFPPGPSE